MRCEHERYLNATILSYTAGFIPAIGRMYFHYVMNILLLQNILDINPFLAIHFEVSVSIFLRIYCSETWLCWSPLLVVKTAKIIEVAKSHDLVHNKFCSYHRAYVQICFNTFAASYLNTQGLNNWCLKSPVSTLVYLTFQSRALRSFSLNQLRNLSL